jgi:FeS assembly protein IscX
LSYIEDFLFSSAKLNGWGLSLVTRQESPVAIQEPSMPPTFGWDNIEEIAIGLTDKFPDTDPLTVRFTDMHKWITGLPGFSGDPAASNESKLEAIQMAWHEEFQDRQS